MRRALILLATGLNLTACGPGPQVMEQDFFSHGTYNPPGEEIAQAPKPNSPAPVSTPNPGPSATPIPTPIPHASPTISYNPPPASAFEQMTDHPSDWGKGTDFYNSLPDGPVVSFKVAIFWVERPSGSGNLVNVPQVNGCWRVQVGDRIMLDSFQKNGSRRECKWNDSPKWFTSNDAEFESVPKDDQPFLFRVKPRVANRDVYLKAIIEGVEAEPICLTTK